MDWTRRKCIATVEEQVKDRVEATSHNFFQTSNQTHNHTFSYLFSRMWLISVILKLVSAKSSPDHFFLSSISFSAAPAHRAPDAPRSNLTRVATPDDNVLVGPFTELPTSTVSTQRACKHASDAAILGFNVGTPHSGKELPETWFQRC